MSNDFEITPSFPSFADRSVPSFAAPCAPMSFKLWYFELAINSLVYMGSDLKHGLNPCFHRLSVAREMRGRTVLRETVFIAITLRLCGRIS